MIRLFLNIAGLVTVLAIAAGYASGEVAAHNAFFLAIATVIIVSGQEFMGRANEQFAKAVRAIAIEPQSYGSSARYGLFVATVIAGVMLSMSVAIAG